MKIKKLVVHIYFKHTHDSQGQQKTGRHGCNGRSAQGLIALWFFILNLLVLESGLVTIFKGGNNMVGCVTPGSKVYSEGGSLVMADVTGTKGFFLNSCCITSLL